MSPDIVRARHQLAVDLTDAPCDQVRVAQGADPDCAIEPARNQIDEPIAIFGTDLKLRVAARHLRQHRREM